MTRQTRNQASRGRPTRHAAWTALCCLAAFAVLSAWVAPASARSALFSASITGVQHLDWSLNGTSSDCEVRRGTGSGAIDFRFKSNKSQLFYVADSHGLKFTGSLPSTAKGTITGAFSDTLATPCEGFVPADPYNAPAGGCGAMQFAINAISMTSHGAFVYVTGAGAFLGAGTTPPGDCPDPVANSLLLSSDLSACGDGEKQWERSWGISSTAGRGLLASRMHISARSLMKTKKGHRKVITGHAVVACNVPAGRYSGGVTYNGDIKYTLTLKRSS